MDAPDKASIGTARDLARNLLKRASIKEGPIFIKDVLTVIKEEFGTDVYGYDLGENISGILIVEGDFSAIGYNDKQHVHRKRFTVAHEIGHLLMGHTCHKKNDYFNTSSPLETEANQFAAELLMPQAFLKNDLKKGMKNISMLATKYWVSEEAMGWRISDPTSKLIFYL
jgi:Zn-dependent peptidase ImmA (M78 family)